MKRLELNNLFYLSLVFLLLSCKEPLSPDYRNESDIYSSNYIPVSPSNLRVTIISDTVSIINWDDRSLGEEGFKLFVKREDNPTFRLLATLDKNLLSYEDTTIKIIDKEYIYRLYSFSGEKLSSEYSETSSKITFEPPTFTIIGGADSNKLVISWKSNTPFPTETVLEKKGISDYQMIAVLTSDKNTYIDNLVDKYHTYQYRLSSRTNYNVSSYSIVASNNFECSDVEFIGSIPANVIPRKYIESSRDGSISLCQSFGNDYIFLLDNRNRMIVRIFSFQQNIVSATLSGDGKLLGVAFGNEGIFNIYSVQNGNMIQSILVTPPAVDLAISNDGSELITSSSDNIIRVWDINSGTIIRSLNGSTSYPTSLSLTSDGMTLISGSANTICLWDWFSGTLLNTTQGDFFERPVYIFKDGNVYDVIYDYMKIIVKNLSHNHIFRALHAPYFTQTGYVTSDELTLVAGGVGEFFVYNLNTGLMSKRIWYGRGHIIIGQSINDTEFVLADLNEASDYKYFRLVFSWVTTYN